MAEHGYDASELARFVEKPYSYEDEYRFAYVAREDETEDSENWRPEVQAELRADWAGAPRTHNYIR